MSGQIERATVQAYDQALHQVDVVPLAQPGCLLSGLPVLEQCPAELLAPGDLVLVQRFDDGQAVVLGPLGDTPAFPVSGRVDDSTLRSFTAQAYTAYSGLSLSLTVAASSALWICATFNARGSVVRGSAFAAAVYVNDAQQAPLLIGGCPGVNCWTPCSLVLCANPAVSAGTHTLSVKLYVYTAGDTIEARYAALSAVALPA